jgi:hypothetical protein
MLEKSSYRKIESNNEVCMLYTKLLRLANDVEENPGPINIYDILDHSFTVRADFIPTLTSTKVIYQCLE